jgi:hypothetical protein
MTALSPTLSNLVAEVKTALNVSVATYDTQIGQKIKNSINDLPVKILDQDVDTSLTAVKDQIQYTAPAGTRAVSNIEVYDSEAERYFPLRGRFSLFGGNIYLSEAVPEAQEGQTMRLWRKINYTEPSGTASTLPQEYTSLVIMDAVMRTAAEFIAREVDIEKYKAIIEVTSQIYKDRLSQVLNER